MTIRLKQPLRVSIYVVVTALAINAVRLVVIRASDHAGPESAFTAILQEIVTDRSGKSSPASTQTRAVRSDGSTLLRLGPAESGSRLIWFASGIEVMTNDRLRLKSTTLKPRGGSHREPGLACVDPHKPMERPLGEETIAGYRTTKIEVAHGQDNPDGRVLTTWYALDHGCAMIKSRLVFAAGDVSESRLVTFVPGEPEGSLFAVPPDYKEGPPSALPGPLDANCGPACQAQRKLRFEKQDAAYYLHRPKDLR